MALFVAGALLVGARPSFDAPASEVAADLARDRTRIQSACALFALAMPFLVSFLVTVTTSASSGAPRARRTATVALACAAIFIALFMADVTALAVAALRPARVAAAPELAATLRDYELLLMGTAAPMAAGWLGASAVLVLRDGAVWPRWVGWLAALAAPIYALRTGTLFTTDGPFAADGGLGLVLPVAALVGWIAVASLVLALKPAGPSARA